MDASILDGIDSNWRRTQKDQARDARDEIDFIDMRARRLVSTPLVELLDAPHPGPMLVGAPTGSGKTYAMAQQLLHPQRLTIAATNTLRAQGELLAYFHEEDVMDLRHGRKCGPFDPSQPVVTNHANLCSRGDAPHEPGRLFLKLEEARKRGMSRPRIFIDEGDAFIASLARTYPLGHRQLADVDPHTQLARNRQAFTCPQDCANCSYHAGISGFSSSFDQFAISSIARPPEGAMTVNADWLLELAGEEHHRSHGWEIRSIDQLAAIEQSERRPRYRLRQDHSKAPLIDGILAGVAASPGATLRRCYPRDSGSGEEIRPQDTEGREVLYPAGPCNVWSLVGWDTEPLRLLLSASPDAVFLSASWGQATSSLLGGVERVDVPTPPERKIKEVLIIVLPTFEWGARRLKPLSALAPVLAFRSTREKVLNMEKTILKADLGGIYIDGALKIPMETEQQIPVIGSYPRSSLGRGLNLGSRRIIIAEADVQGGIGYTPVTAADTPLEAIEEERRGLLLQAFGRALREDESGRDDDLRRVIILVGGREGRNGPFLDDGLWLERALLETCEKVSLVQLLKYPARCVPLCEQFLNGLPITIDDSKKLRAVDPEAYKVVQARREEKRQQKLETKREQVLEAAEKAAKQGISWRDFGKRNNIHRYFDKQAIDYIKKRYEEMKMGTE